MAKSNLRQHSSPICSQCGSPLILVSQETVQPEGTRYQQTNSIYKCSNEDCQKNKDKEKAERMKQREKRLAAEKQREEKMLEKKMLAKKETN